MPTIADIVREHAAAYLERFAEAVLPSHLRALLDIGSCRTADMGGHVLACDDCGHREFVYHSCRNRACPRCRTFLLPVRALSSLFRAKFAARVRRQLPDFQMPGAVWRTVPPAVPNASGAPGASLPAPQYAAPAAEPPRHDSPPAKPPAAPRRPSSSRRTATLPLARNPVFARFPPSDDHPKRPSAGFRRLHLPRRPATVTVGRAMVRR